MMIYLLKQEKDNFPVSWFVHGMKNTYIQSILIKYFIKNNVDFILLLQNIAGIVIDMW